MLFNDQTAVIAQAIYSGHVGMMQQERKQRAALMQDYYNGVQLEHLREILTQKFAQPEKLQPVCVNVVRKVINGLSLIYVEPPKRSILDGTDQDAAIFQEIAERSGLTVRMKHAARLVKLLGTGMMRVVWRDGGIALDFLAGDVLDVECGDCPESIKSVLVTHYPASGKTEEVEYSLWGLDGWQRLNYRGRVIESGPNPYGCIPFVPMWNSPPMDAFWLPQADDLLSLQQAINTKLTDLLHVIEQQGFGVGYVRGAGSGGGQLQAGPGSLIELPEGGELGFASASAPIEEVVAAIDKLLKWAAVSHGIPAASLSTEPSTESGVSKIVSNTELQELRADDIELWRGYERKLFETIKAVWNAHSPGRKISEKASLSIDFADPRPETSALDQARTWELLIGMGLRSPVDAALELNPDLGTREEALAYLLQVQQERAALTENTI